MILVCNQSIYESEVGRARMDLIERLQYETRLSLKNNKTPTLQSAASRSGKSDLDYGNIKFSIWRNGMCHASFVNSEISRIVTEKYQRCQENAEND